MSSAELKTCAFKECENRSSTRKLCSGHYAQKNRGKELKPLRKKAKPTPWINGLRVCPSCQELKGEDDYSRNVTQASGFDSHCRECFRWKNVAHRYNLTKTEWLAIWAYQGRRCASCGSTDPRSEKGFHTDHNHACCDSRESCGDCVTGITCGPCNLLGERWKSNQFHAYRERVSALGIPLRQHLASNYFTPA